VPITRICRVEGRCIDLGKIDRINDLCRRACRSAPPLDDLQQKVMAIDRAPGSPRSLQAVGFAGVAFAFTLFFGGTAADAAVGALTGLLVYWLQSVFCKIPCQFFFLHNFRERRHWCHLPWCGALFFRISAQTA
jgi:uncharacterized membrane protein YjjP (DUF1212 family)